ncbi:MAG: hypothetical protein LC808_30190, partial [Actinobacteria bacterium]|nr:hypothetical protein [Actinomycetota bacterium]
APGRPETARHPASRAPLIDDSERSTLRDCGAVTHSKRRGTEKGRPKRLAHLNNDLKAMDAYDEGERAQVEAWLKLRNEVGHGRGETVSIRRVEALLAGIGAFLVDHPSPGA